MILIYFLIGILAAIVGAIPLGASNVVVINTTIRQNAQQAFKIAFAAGIAEVVLSYYALHCNMIVRDFFDANMWIQILLAVVLLGVGAFLFFKRTRKMNANSKGWFRSRYLTGFVLGLLNPPVLIYWILVFGIINNNDLMLSFNSPLSVLFLFFFGVYTGKLLTLMLYSRFSTIIKNRVSNLTLIINKVTGVLLVVVGIAQAVKLYAF